MFTPNKSIFFSLFFLFIHIILSCLVFCNSPPATSLWPSTRQIRPTRFIVKTWCSIEYKILDTTSKYSTKHIRRYSNRKTLNTVHIFYFMHLTFCFHVYCTQKCERSFSRLVKIEYDLKTLDYTLHNPRVGNSWY